MLTLKKVLERVKATCARQQKSWRTEECYCGWIARYYRFCEALRQPASGARLSHEQKMESFLSMLAREREVSASTQNQAFNAIRFLLTEVCGWQLGDVEGLRAQRSTFARHCPSRSEVMALLRELPHAPGQPQRLIVGVMYGSGLRVNEALGLRLKDVRMEDGHFVLRDTKSNRDRWAKIPEVLRPALKRQVEYARRVFECDQLHQPAPLPLQIPGALARKYPRSPFTIGWMFLFPSPRPMRHPRTKQVVRLHFPDYLMQRACREASARARLIAAVTPHCLRHAFASHFDGDIRDLQELLGHKSLETTQIYRHPELERATSPLDRMFPVAPQRALAS